MIVVQAFLAHFDPFKLTLYHCEREHVWALRIHEFLLRLA